MTKKVWIIWAQIIIYYYHPRLIGSWQPISVICYLCGMRAKIRYELYDASKSVEDNAAALGCSVSAVRKFVRKKQIDRQYDVTYIKWKRIHDFCKGHPDASYEKKKEALGYAINTIKKYERLTEEQIYSSIRDTRKVSDFDIRNINSIKSVSSHQDDILRWILHLYNGDKTFDADLTASMLLFYKTIPVPEHLYDKYPQLPQVNDLNEADALPDDSFSSLVYDLPFVISSGASSIIKKRFTHFTSVEELYQANDEMLDRAIRLLRRNGLLVVKTMDVNHGGKQEWVSDYVLTKAKVKGLELLDKFILVAPFKLFNRTHSQHQARKYHSYFFVFRKH